MTLNSLLQITKSFSSKHASRGFEEFGYFPRLEIAWKQVNFLILLGSRNKQHFYSLIKFEASKKQRILLLRLTLKNSIFLHLKFWLFTTNGELH